MSQPQTMQVPTVPTVEQLTAAITNLIVQRAQAKEQVEAIEKQLPVLQGQLQLLNTIAKVAEEAAGPEAQD